VGKRQRRAKRRALAARPAPQPRQHPPDQKMARVNVSEDDWQDFRALALASNRSVANYLGHLLQKELRRARRRAGSARILVVTPVTQTEPRASDDQPGSMSHPIPILDDVRNADGLD